MTKKERYRYVMEWFLHNMPDAESELNFSNPFELLVAVMLSAQCTDKRVNMVTPSLFARFPDAHSMASASLDELFPYVKSVSYPNSKAAHLLEMSQMLSSEFDGVVPSSMEDLTRLPGVGRKTANVVLAVAFGKAAMPVDTHVFRVSNRVGLTDNSKTPEATERILTKYIPSDILGRAHHWLLLHGRYVCTARSPQCEKCGISSYCKSFGK